MHRISAGILLLATSLSLSAETTPDRNQLITAAEAGEIIAVQRLLEAGVNIDGQSDDGSTALTQASFHGRYDMVEFLVRRVRI